MIWGRFALPDDLLNNTSLLNVWAVLIARAYRSCLPSHSTLAPARVPLFARLVSLARPEVIEAGATRVHHRLPFKNRACTLVVRVNNHE